MQKRIISPEDFAENYKEGITNDLDYVIGNLQGIAAADPKLQKDLSQSIAKLNNALDTLCDVPPPCTGKPRGNKGS